MKQLYIGLISGTSLDALDAALTEIEGDRIALRATHSHPIPTELRQRLLSLCLPGDGEIDRLGQAEIDFAALCVQAVSDLLDLAGVDAGAITAIGSHGQTVRHRPPNATAGSGFTLQLGDPNTLAVLTGIDTVADFRRADMALGGQGAPLASGFHRFVFGATDENRAIVNIGGMSNVTLLEADGRIAGCDTGPGNVLMDTWIQSQHNTPFDRDGAWAASGHIDDALLARLMADEYLARKGPKSTGRETYNADFLARQLALAEPVPAVDVQATLLEFTASSIAAGIPPDTDAVYVCGGGAHNRTLMARLGELLGGISLHSTAALGISPDWVEAAAFAWLAHCRVHGLAGNVPEVTGARRAAVLGGIYRGANPVSPQ